MNIYGRNGAYTSGLLGSIPGQDAEKRCMGVVRTVQIGGRIHRCGAKQEKLGTAQFWVCCELNQNKSLELR